MKHQPQNPSNAVVDRWYIFFPPDENRDFLKEAVEINGNRVFDFSQIEDVLFALNYTYAVPKPKLNN